MGDDIDCPMLAFRLELRVTDLLRDPESLKRMSEAPCPYGDGDTGEKIMDSLSKLHSKNSHGS
jgi:UDP-N-acetylglucosamine 2-epimerase